jgi:hypothetical protein
LEEGEAIIRATLHDGTALAKFGAMAAAQGVSADVAAKLVQVRYSTAPTYAPACLDASHPEIADPPISIQDPWLVLPKASQVDDVLANSR